MMGWTTVTQFLFTKKGGVRIVCLERRLPMCKLLTIKESLDGGDPEKYEKNQKPKFKQIGHA
jgi:hypothetical protein